MAQNDIYLVREASDGTFEEIANSPFRYDAASATDQPDKANNTFHINTKLRVDELEVNGDTTVIHTDSNTTEQLSVTNDGTGPAAIINQIGAEPLIDIQDDGVSALYIADGGNVGIGTTNPVAPLHVVGNSIFADPDGIGSYLIIGHPSTGGAQSVQIRMYDSNDVLNMNLIGGASYEFLNGNVGIGPLGASSVAGDMLHISTPELNCGLTLHAETKQAKLTANNEGTLLLFAGNGGSAPDSKMVFSVNDSEAMRIRNNGNVGIGATSPYAKLHIGDDSADPSIYIGKTNDTNNLQLKYDITNDYGIVEAWDANASSGVSTTLALNPSGGNVGIGTSSPTSKLHLSIDSGTGGDSAINFTAQDQASPEWEEAFKHSIRARMASNNDLNKNFLAFDICSGASGATGSPVGTQAQNVLVLNGTGNVGIGTSSPSATLDVVGPNDVGTFFSAMNDGAAGADFKRVGNSDPYNHFLFHNGNVGIGTSSPSALLDVAGETNPEIIITDTDPNSAAAGTFRAEDGGVTLGTYSDHPLYLAANNTTHMTITNAGDVGIGTTTPSAILEVSRLDQSETEPALKVIRGDTGIDHRPTAPIFNVFNGSAGGTEVFRVRGDGNVGIGTTSPVAPLHVVGNSIFADPDGIGSSLIIGHPSTGGAQSAQIRMYDSNDVLNMNLIGGASYEFLNGNVGIGATNPVNQLEIGDSTSWFSGNQLAFGDGTTGAALNVTTDYDGIAGNNYVRLMSTSGIMFAPGVGVGASSGANAMVLSESGDLNVTGDINFTGDLYQDGVQFSGGSSSGGGTSFGGGSPSSDYPNPLDVSGDTSSGVSLTISSTYDEGTDVAGSAGNTWRLLSDGDGSFKIAAHGSSIYNMLELYGDGSNGTNVANEKSLCVLNVAQLTSNPGNGEPFEFVNRGDNNENGGGFQFWPHTGADGAMLTIGVPGDDTYSSSIQNRVGIQDAYLYCNGRLKNAVGESVNQDGTELKLLSQMGHKTTYYGHVDFDLTDEDPSDDIYFFHLAFRSEGEGNLNGFKYKAEIGSSRKSTMDNQLHFVNTGFASDESFVYFEDDLDFFTNSQHIGTLESIGEIEIVSRVVYPTQEAAPAGYTGSWKWGMAGLPEHSDLSLDNQKNYVVRYGVRLSSLIEGGLGVSSEKEGRLHIQLEVMSAGEYHKGVLAPHFMHIPASTAAPSVGGLEYDPSPSTPNRIHFGWNDVPGAGRTYIVQVATDSGFTNLVHSVASYGAAQESVSGLTANTIYYVRVKANPITGESGPSTTWRSIVVTTKT